MKRMKPAKPDEMDDIQNMIETMKDEMPELKRQLDRLEAEAELPPGLNTPPVPEETWFGRLGNWAVRPGRPFQVLGHVSESGMAVTVLPTFLGGIFVPLLLLFRLF